MKLYVIALFVHIASVLIGGGGAVASDWLFFASLKNKVIDRSELGLLKSMSVLVWIGIVFTTISGLVLIWLKPELLSVFAFRFKLVLFFIIVVNGLFFARYHMKHLQRLQGKNFLNKMRTIELRLLVMSGVISFVSWMSVLFISTTKLQGLSEVIAVAGYCGLLAAGYILATILLRVIWKGSKSGG
ncbi:MAG TPA: hypothetical protein VEA59_01020 [Patescibacteria group bacterium]|nr:hypothetical protein [Patescibacteria group bacterium]